LDTPVQRENFQSPPRSDNRTGSFTPQGPKERTWAYYQELKKTNPKVYYDPKTQVQMHHDAVALEEKFKDGDFNAL